MGGKWHHSVGHGSNHELLIAKFRLKLKKVGKTTRPFRYDLNQIPYDCTVEVRNRFKGLDLIDTECLKIYGQRFVTLYRRDGPPTPVFLGFPCGSTGKESACNVGDLV